MKNLLGPVVAFLIPVSAPPFLLRVLTARISHPFLPSSNQPPTSSFEDNVPVFASLSRFTNRFLRPPW